jgi:hypothetical protein
MKLRTTHTLGGPALAVTIAALVFGDANAARAQQAVTIRNQKSGMVLTARGQEVVQATLQAGNQHQCWYMLGGPGGLYQIVNQATGAAMTVERGDDTTPVRLLDRTRDQGNQRWRLQPTGVGQYVLIVPALYDKALDVPRGAATPGLPIQIFKNHGKDNQRWLVEPVR